MAMTFTLALDAGQAGMEAELLPDANLSRIGPAWRATGERACFALALPEGIRSFPAGWYEVRMVLQSEDDAGIAPCLHTFSGAEGKVLVPLPRPGSRGEIRTLVLFKHPLTRLLFSACPGPANFRLSSVSLVRLSRFQALLRMIRLPVPSPGGVPGRTVRFLGNAARGGIRNAADSMYREYRERLVPPSMDDYADWVERHDTLSGEKMQAMQARAAAIGSEGPLISILLPLYETPEPYLRRCIESVLAQVWSKWELCIVDDASPDPRTAEIAREYARDDSRIRMLRRGVNGHISEASNSALELATGDFVALLDHDDELRPHALLEVVEEILRHPDAGLVYSDEDKIDAGRVRFNPYFKPDFDPDLLRSQNYICHLTVIRTALVREVGGFRKGFEGSQDHDLILRCIERLQPAQIRHIPKILYHWRAIPGSTAFSRDAKDYASSAGARAVAEHLQRQHSGAHVEELPHGHYRVHWPLPPTPPKVSLVIPTRDRVDLLRTCVESILDRTTYPDYEILVVDNRSSEARTLDYLASLQAYDRVRVLRHDAPFNYSAINNEAVKQCQGSVLALINNDIEVITPGWLEELVSHALRPDVGAVGAMLYYPDDSIQHAGVMLGVHGIAGHIYSGLPRGYPGHGGRALVAQSLSAVTGACLVLRRAVFEEAGGLDEQLTVAFNDIDLCLRLRAMGYRNIWTPFAELYHHESASRGREDTDEKKRRFAAEIALMESRWGDELPFDPAYNPNLSLNSFSCELASQPRQPRWR